MQFLVSQKSQPRSVRSPESRCQPRSFYLFPQFSILFRAGRPPFIPVSRAPIILEAGCKNQWRTFRSIFSRRRPPPHFVRTRNENLSITRASCLERQLVSIVSDNRYSRKPCVLQRYRLSSTVSSSSPSSSSVFFEWNKIEERLKMKLAATNHRHWKLKRSWKFDESLLHLASDHFAFWYFVYVNLVLWNS